MASSKTGIGSALSLVCLCILGVLPIISNSRPGDFSALGFAFFLSAWQFVFAVPLFVYELRSGDKGFFGAAFLHGKVHRTVIVALVTGVMFGLSTYLYVLGVERAGATSAAIAIQSYPLFAILWETLFLKRSKTRVELLLTAVLIGALYYLATGGTGEIDVISPWFLLTLAVPFLWSIAHVIIKEELGRTAITPAQVTFFRVAVSTVFLAAALAIVEPAAFTVAVRRLDFQAFALVMGLIYYLELIIWFYAVRFIDVSLASSITTPWPALTMVLAVIFLGDPVEAYQIGAFILVAGCIYGLMLAGFRKERSPMAIPSSPDRL